MPRGKPGTGPYAGQRRQKQKTRSPKTGKTYNNHYHSYSKQNHPGDKGGSGPRTKGGVALAVRCPKNGPRLKRTCRHNSESVQPKRLPETLLSQRGMQPAGGLEPRPPECDPGPASDARSVTRRANPGTVVGPGWPDGQPRTLSSLLAAV